MLKNKAGQYFHVIAFDSNGRVSGDAANITCELSIDGGPRNILNGSAEEIGNTGEYTFPLTQTETDGHALSFTPSSSTAGVQVLGVPSNVIYTDVILSLYSGSGSNTIPTIKRGPGDTSPIWFSWDSYETLSAEKSFNFGPFSPIDGLIEFESEQGGFYFYKLNYHPSDRGGLNTRYKITDGVVERYLTLIESTDGDSGDILGLLINIQDRLNFLMPSGFEPMCNQKDDKYTLQLIRGDDYKSEDNRQIIWKGKYENQWPNLTGSNIIMGIGATKIVKECVVIQGSGIQEIHLDLTKSDTNITPGTYEYDLQATLSNNNVVTLLRSKLQIISSFTD